MTATLKQVRTALSTTVETVGRNKLGQFVVRRGFFYRHGMNEVKFAEQVQSKLAESSLDLKVVDRGEKYVAFRGGHTTAQGSHWYVVVA